MRKPDFNIYENKGADQLCSNCTADQPLCFRYTDSTIPPHSVYPSVCRTDGYGTDRRLQEHALFRAKNVFPFF